MYRSLIIFRSLQTSAIRRRLASSSKVTTYEEITIPVPWGHISGKWWGDRKTAPIVALHDFRQNASAFDNLIPKLNASSVLALDLPGHGRSSHFPSGRFCTQLEFLLALRYVAHRIPPTLLTFIGHGYGSTLAFIYSAAYNKQVSALMSIDCTRHIVTQLSTSRANTTGDIIDTFFEIEKTPRQSYSKSQLISIIKKTDGKMSDEAANILLTRASTIDGEKYNFANDPRYRLHPLFSFSDENMMVVADQIRCRTAVIRNVLEYDLRDLEPELAGRSGYLDENNSLLIRRKGSGLVKNLNDQSLQHLEEYCRFLKKEEIQVPQHILLDASDEIASILNKFLTTNLETHEVVQKIKQMV